jgi:hypothetical protein
MMTGKNRLRAVVALFLSAGIPAMALADPLADGFRDPPASARPRVWWHWMNGNVTREGIAKDLAWMKRAGIGGFQAFDANQETPQIVKKRLAYMTPEWKDAFRYTVELADELGLEMAIAAAPGWSETGGPWVTPEDGMKKLVWSEARVTGGKAISLRLSAPPATTGPFQDMPITGTAPSFYKDVAVLAYRITDGKPLPAPHIASTDGKAIDVAALGDDSLETAAEIAPGTRQAPAIVTLDYDRAQTIRSATLFAPGIGPTMFSAGLLPRLEASEDGQAWRKVADIAVDTTPSTASFAPATARHFRIVFATAPGGVVRPSGGVPKGVDLGGMAGMMGMGGSKQLRIADLRLSGEAKVNQFAVKAGFSIPSDYAALDGDVGPDIPGVAPGDVVNLSARVGPDGLLNWTPPRGNWRIVRLGWSLIGKMNHPAPQEATGLEVDKMDAAAVRRYLDHYLAMYRDAAGADNMGARGIRALLTDSTEVGPFNWTPTMIGEFTRLRGYDPTPWLPALTGAIIGSRRQSDAFLHDFRQTIADLHSSAHYGTVAQVARENGLKLYGEALENGRPSLGDDMSMRAHADYPMAAMWYIPRGVPLRANFLADMKGASSVAHIYGQNIAAAESLTSALTPWASGPAELRQIIDLEFAYGINRPVIHTSVHQPVDDKVPGLSLGMFGQYFTRHETWAEMARPWIDYIARNAYMLQQGRNVADVGYVYGEETPLTQLYKTAPPADAPTRHAYDFVNADAVLGNLSVEGNEIVASGGARYRLLYLGGTSRSMTLPVLRRLAALVEAGGTIAGPAPEGSPSLKDDATAYAALVKRLWTGAPVSMVGKGRVIAAPKDAEAALAAIGVAPDFAYAKPAADSEWLFVHRKLDDGEAYFVTNRRFRAEKGEARFRVTGKAPEIWRADTSAAQPVSYRIEGEETIVPLDMGPEESFYVLFRKPASAPQLTVAAPAPVPVATLDGAWDVTFQPGRGAPATLRLDSLGSLSDQSDPGVKYFSGIATYRKDFVRPSAPRPGEKLLLDLGKIGDLAEVRVNGALVGTVWHTPYRLDIGSAVRAGNNRLEVRVANLWANRLIGDMQPGATKITYTAAPTYTAKAPLRPSGLIGPVTLMTTGQ